MRSVWVVLAVLSGVVGCTGSEAATANGGQHACVTGLGCSCDNGAPGLTACQGQTQVCDCSACQAYAQHTTPAFTACGGDPAGVWNLMESDTSNVVYHLQTSITGPDVPCDAFDFQETPAGVVSITFSPNGTGFLTATSGATSFKVFETCARSTFQPKSGNACDAAGCTVSASCGLCNCSRLAVDGIASPLTWSKTATALTYTVEARKQAVQLQYCVDGDTLTMFSERTNIILKYGR